MVHCTERMAGVGKSRRGVYHHHLLDFIVVAQLFRHGVGGKAFHEYS